MRQQSLVGFIVSGIVIFFALVLPFVSWLAGVWLDILWYTDLGQRDVFVTRLVSQIAIFGIFALAAFLLLFINMRIARNMAPNAVPINLPETVPLQVEEALNAAREKMSPLLDKAILWGAVALAFFNGLAMSSQWQTYRIAMASTPFPINDPQFGRNIAFYIFQLPALRSIADWLTGILVLVAVLSIVVHVLDGAIQPWARLKGFAPHVKAHLSVLMAAIVLSAAYRYWLDMWELNFSPRGQVVGASYTDVHAQLPAYRILIVISVITAVALLFNIRFKGWRLPMIAVGTWAAASILLGTVWPALMQQFVVNPNEVALESPYIKRNIEMTRAAYGLTAVEGRLFPATENLTAKDIVADRQTLQNVRLWDPDIVSQVYGQLQSLRTYYEFSDVDVDRYVIDGKKKQVLVSAREMNSGLLPEQSQTWVNRHLVYTHGFGLVMSPVNEADPRGLPVFTIGQVPPRTTTDLKTEQGRIYFGEKTDDYVVIGTGMKEFDYPLGEKNAEYEYQGPGGVEVGSLGRRLAWALHLGSSQMLFSNYITADSRVLMRRNIVERVDELAPWLWLEDDPYPVLVDGRITWVIDAYTYSGDFPYSQPIYDGVNYMRNSVKVTVDAYTGETTFYAFDENDPVLKAWRTVFPTLIQDGDKIPAQIREHFRYPQGLFTAQAEIYRNYHMTDPRVFYNKEDSWEIPGERKGKPMEPFFVLMKLPGETEEHFFLMQPYTPRNRDNMIGWVAANSDPEGYGDRTVYLFPKERVLLGPEQVHAQINQDAAISPQLSLWNQRGSNAIFGNMLVIPIKNSIVYIQPLFLQAESTSIPELTRIIVVYAEKVEMEKTLEAALLKVFGVEQAEGGKPGDGGTIAGAQDVAAAAKLYREALEAQKAGDWAAYGQKIGELGRILEKLAESKDATSTQ